MSAETVLLECRWEDCDRELTAQGHKNHETHCDHNPRPGVPYETQESIAEDIDAFDGPEHVGAAEPSGPDPNRVPSTDGGLPEATTLASDKSAPTSSEPPEPEPEDSGQDSGGPESCPLCGCDDVLAGDDAKAAYIDTVEDLNAKAALAYDMADWACQSPPCAALWGRKYEEPLPMAVVLDA